MIRIKKIAFENYRQYKNISVSFDDNSEHNLHILRAKNGTGKTTFLNGILWCLYEHEHYLNDKDKALPIANSTAVENTEEKNSIRVRVNLLLEDETNNIEFERTQIFTVSASPLSGKKNAYPGSSTLKVTITPKDKPENTKVSEDDLEVQSLVKQYFDEAIYDYYFFDGENLKNYFSQGKSEKIKSSIFNISQVTLLENAARHARSMSEEKSRKSAKIKGDNGNLYDEVSQLASDIDRLEKENKKIDEELPELKKKVADADAALEGYAPIRMNIERRKVLDGEYRATKSGYDDFKDKKRVFIRKYLTLLNYYPRVKNTLEIIHQKQKDGKLPPSIDKKQVCEILENHVKNCPVCNAEIDENAITHLQSVLNELDVSSATSNYLMEIKSSLEEIVSECESFPDERDKLIQEEKYYVDELAKKELELQQISAFLTAYSNADGESIDVKKIEAERESNRQKITSKEQRKLLNERDIKDYKKEKEQKEGEIKKQEGKRDNKALLNRQVTILRRLSSSFDLVQKGIMDDLKDDIQKETWNRFESMIWKRNTFGSLSINDSYEITVLNKAGNEMTGSLSATEYMALAYSFTLAIHEASGKNCPLVVDSPLGRVSDENRENMARELLEVSKEKQIIMLFTPDEYSEDVSKVYDGTIASIRDISLSSDESEVERVGE